MKAITLPSSKAKIVLKDELTRKESREYDSILYNNAKSTASGELDQSSMIKNIDDQKDKLIMAYVESFNEKPITMDTVDSLVNSDFLFLLKACQEIHMKNTEKKS